MTSFNFYVSLLIVVKFKKIFFTSVKVVRGVHIVVTSVVSCENTYFSEALIVPRIMLRSFLFLKLKQFTKTI